MRRIFTGVLAISFTIFSLIISAALQGIIGNRADAVFLQTLPIIGFIFKIQINLWVAIACILIVLTIFWLWITPLQRAHKLSGAIIQADDTLFRILLEVEENQIDDVVKDLLNSEFELYKKYSITQSCLIKLYIPNQAKDYLKYWMHCGAMYDAPRDIYIGNNQSILQGMGNQKDEIAKAFLYKEGQSMLPQNRGRSNNRDITYRSGICVPVIGRGENCLAVLTVESSEERKFDSGNMKGIVASFALRLSLVLERRRSF
jgi:hypothetical protein